MYYPFRIQVGNRGCLAEIHLETVTDKNKPFNLVFEYHGAPRWEQVCRVAADIFFDYYKWLAEGELQVMIEQVDWMPVDTNSLIVLYATVDALSKHLSMEIPNLAFNKEQETFTFPECRTLAVARDRG